MNLNGSVSVLWCSFIPHLSSCKNNVLLKPSSARAVDLDISFGSWQIFSCFETKLKPRLKVAMSIFLIIWNVVTTNATLPIKRIDSRISSRWYADKLTFYSKSSGFLWDFQAWSCAHWVQHGVSGYVELKFVHAQKTDLVSWEPAEHVLWSVCVFSDTPNANNQRKKGAERQASLEKPRSGYLLCDMRGGLFLYPVSRHTGWDLWQCTLNSAISFPIETSKWHTSMCWAIHVFSYSIRNYSSAEWEYYEPGCLVSKVGHSNFGLHLNRH